MPGLEHVRLGGGERQPEEVLHLRRVRIRPTAQHRGLHDGMLVLPLPADRPLQQLARPDLGRFAAAVLSAPAAFLGQRIELASDEPTPTQMAAALGAALGRTVRHEEVPLTAIELPDMRAMWEFLRGPGYRVDLPTLHATYPALRWTSFADWADQTMGASS